MKLLMTFKRIHWTVILLQKLTMKKRIVLRLDGTEVDRIMTICYRVQRPVQTLLTCHLALTEAVMTNGSTKALEMTILERHVIKYLPMSVSGWELDFIEVQQQGLEIPGVRLDYQRKTRGNINRKKSDKWGLAYRSGGSNLTTVNNTLTKKTEMFRNQAELMYSKRQELWEVHTDVEYQIRCLMLKPVDNKTDSARARKGELRVRLIDIVKRRNEINECLGMDRIWEAEEDSYITNHINVYTFKSDKSEPDKIHEEIKREKKKNIKENQSRSIKAKAKSVLTKI